MLYWFFLQRIFTVLIVMILAWNLRFLTLVRLKCHFKRKMRWKDTFAFCFCLICTDEFGKESFFLSFDFDLKVKFLALGEGCAVGFFFLLCVRLLSRLLKIGSPYCCAKNFLFIGPLFKTLICMSQDTKWLCRIIFWNLIKW